MLAAALTTPFMKDAAELMEQKVEQDRRSDPQLAVIALEVRNNRRKKQLSLEQLADLSGVSRSMISKVERCEAVPSTTVLAKLAEALGVTFSQLMSQPVEREVIVISSASQPVLRDDATGFLRRCLSPVLPGRGIDWVMNTLPAKASTGTFGAHRRGVEEYIYVLKGQLKATIGCESYLLQTGDLVYFQADLDHSFTNAGTEESIYFLVIDSSKLHR